MHTQGSVQRGQGLCQNSFRACSQLLDPIQTPSTTYSPQLLITGVQCYVQGLVWADKGPPADRVEQSSTELLRIGSKSEEPEAEYEDRAGRDGGETREAGGRVGRGGGKGIKFSSCHCYCTMQYMK